MSASRAPGTPEARGAARRVAAAAILLGALLGASAALALSDQGKRAYQEGLRAFENEEFERAAGKMREAVRDDPAEGVRKFRGSGVNYDDYFPHLYLGLALEKMGKAPEAAAALQESQRQGVSRQRAALHARLVQALARAEAEVVAQVRPTPTHAPALPATPTPRPAQPTLPIPTPTATPRPLPTMRPTVTQPTPTIAIPPAVPTAPLPTPGPTIIPIPPPEPRGGASSEQLLADLKSGIRSYFRGDYDAAVRVLERHREASSTARLFVAYSLAGKYLLASARDEKVLARAREEFRAARAAGAAGREDKLISRSVRTILEKG